MQQETWVKQMQVSKVNNNKTGVGGHGGNLLTVSLCKLHRNTFVVQVNISDKSNH